MQTKAHAQDDGQSGPVQLCAISLYTGAGGLDLGFERGGFETRVAVEFDPEAVQTLRANRPQWGIVDSDIHAPPAASRNLLRVAELAVGDADILIGGPPCQPFSKSGYWARGDARRLEDPRSSTLAAYLRVLRDTQPRAFLLENVPGLAFDQKDEGLVLLRRSLESINREVGTAYSFSVGLLRAVEHGVPQFRERVFVVGARDGATFRFPAPTHAGLDDQDSAHLHTDADCLVRSEPYRTAWDAIGDLEADDDPALRMTGKWATLLPSIPEGKNYLHHTERGEGIPLFGWRRRYWNFLLKLSKSLPSWTIAAQPGPATGPFHWKNRRLSVREMARIQTFPDDYQVVGSLRSAQRQIGNAVPSALAERLALEIRRQLFGDVTVTSTVASLIPPQRGVPPLPETVLPVPREYLALKGVHAAHPGTGQGYGALRRAAGTR